MKVLGFTPADHDAGWAEAARLYARLVGGGQLLPLPPSGIVPQPGEQIYATMPLEFAQFSGMNV